MSRVLGIIGNCSYNALDLGGLGGVAVLAAARLELRLRPAARPRARRRVRRRGRRTSPTSQQEYIENTNVLRTVFAGSSGLVRADRLRAAVPAVRPAVQAVDARPRAATARGRSARPRPLPADLGLRPRRRRRRWRASNHIEYTGLPAPVRLTTNVPLSYVEEERPFLLERDHHLVLTWGQPLEAGLEETAERFLERTLDYWRAWVKGTRVPRDYQREVIRSALVLKLHQYEDTGALLAATTTSLPEHPGSGRTWDYRYCWLRDAYFTLNAFERLGHSDEMERFLVYLRNLAEERAGELQPVYTITGGGDAEEIELDHLAGFEGERPVRDRQPGVPPRPERRLRRDDPRRQPAPARRALRRLGLDAAGRAARQRARCEQIDERLEEPDAGLWELRGVRGCTAFTVLTHWAGARRAAEIGDALDAPELADAGDGDRRNARRAARGALLGPARSAHSRRRPASRSSTPRCCWRVHLGFFEPDDPRAATHVDAIRAALVGRRRHPPPLHRPGRLRPAEAAFTVCSFWLVEALALLGRKDDAARAVRGPAVAPQRPRALQRGHPPRDAARRAATSRRRTATSA